jgi:hypothetical protein
MDGNLMDVRAKTKTLGGGEDECGVELENSINFAENCNKISF